MNLRTIVLRDEEGTVHVFPNGEVKTLANKSKDFSYYVVTFGIGYDEDPERVTAAMRDAALTLEQDPEFKPHILAPFEILGIDAFEPGQLVLKARGIAPPTGRMIVKLENSQPPTPNSQDAP